MKTFKIVVLAFFAIAIGLYPLVFLITDMSTQGLLASKDSEVLNNRLWNICFYLHIGFGGLSLLTGWSQFSESIRNKFMLWHRRLGMIYLVSVCFSGIAGLYLSFFANGGLISSLGFGFLAVGWLFSSSIAYRSIKKGNIRAHQVWMIRSYAFTFAAVALRLWLPLLTGILQMDFMDAYRLVSWLCWVPNIAVAEIIISRLRTAHKSFPLSK